MTGQQRAGGREKAIMSASDGTARDVAALRREIGGQFASAADGQCPRCAPLNLKRPHGNFRASREF
jgi:hypothetical protein